MTLDVSLSSLCDHLDDFRPDCTDETAMQGSIESALLDREVSFEREFSLDRTSRIDFMTPEGIGIECKVRGNPSDVFRQLARYSEFASVRALILFTTRARLGSLLPEELNSKPIRVITTWRNSL